MTRYTLLLDTRRPGGAPCLLDEYGDTLREAPQFVAGDVVEVAARFALPAGTTQEPAPGIAYQETGASQDRWLSLGIRATAAGPLLASAPAFVRGSFVVGTTTYYEHVATLSLNTDEADTAAASGAVAVVVDIEVRNHATAGQETLRQTWQFAGILNPQMYRAAEPAPVETPTPVTEANLTAMIRDGQIVLTDTVTAATYQLTIAGGTIALVPVEEEE
jgi:hypothetical protein